MNPARHQKICAEIQQMHAKEIAALRETQHKFGQVQHDLLTQIDQLRAEVADHQRKFAALLDDYENACKLVADMHAAAMGAKVGPRLGVVEDVAAVRSENDALRAEATQLRQYLDTAQRRASALGDEVAGLTEALQSADASFETVEIYMPDGCKDEFAFYAGWEDVRTALAARKGTT